MLAVFLFTTLHAWAAAPAKLPLIGGDWVELRKAPVFDSEKLSLSKNWGGRMVADTPFQVEKVYGRWLYGRPLSPPKMPAKDAAQPGWVYSRMMIAPGDRDTRSARQRASGPSVIFHSREAWRKLALGEGLLPRLDFYDSLVLTEQALQGFALRDEVATPSAIPAAPTPAHTLKSEPEPEEKPAAPLSWWAKLVSTAQADESKAPAPLGLSGPDLSFLDREFKVVATKKTQEIERKRRGIFQPPKTPILDESARAGVLGRFLVQKYLELPPLTQEEIDGNAYMRILALRSLRGCPAPVQNFWKERRWTHLRVQRLRARPEEQSPWLEASLPGGYFILSTRALDLAEDEAQLAYLVIRPLVQVWKSRALASVSAKGWPGSLESRAQEIWQEKIRPLNIQDPKAPDISVELAIDSVVFECLQKAGYDAHAAVKYLEKMELLKEAPWSTWFFEHTIGNGYRAERLAAILNEQIAPTRALRNSARFHRVMKQWNLKP